MQKKAHFRTYTQKEGAASLMSTFSNVFISELIKVLRWIKQFSWISSLIKRQLSTNLIHRSLLAASLHLPLT